MNYILPLQLGPDMCKNIGQIHSIPGQDNVPLMNMMWKIWQFFVMWSIVPSFYQFSPLLPVI